MTPDTRFGACSCGGVTYEIHGPAGDVLHCHCENCRRLSGNFVAATRVAATSLAITDRDGALQWHDLGYARYGFCGSCGSTLFYQAADRTELMSVMVGTLDDADDLTVAAVWFADGAQQHHQLPAGVPHHRGNG